MKHLISSSTSLKGKRCIRAQDSLTLSRLLKSLNVNLWWWRNGKCTLPHTHSHSHTHSHTQAQRKADREAHTSGGHLSEWTGRIAGRVTTHGGPNRFDQAKTKLADKQLWNAFRHVHSKTKKRKHWKNNLLRGRPRDLFLLCTAIKVNGTCTSVLLHIQIHVHSAKILLI